MKIDHIGVICEKLHESVKHYKSLGFTVIHDLVTDYSRNLDYIFVKNSSYVLELITKHDENKKSDIDTLLTEKRLPGNKMYHLCFLSENIEKDIESYKSKGYKLIKSPEIAVACGNRRVAFMIHFDFGLIELLESK